MTDLKGKVILVTGGSRGIGRAVALKAASYGADVAVNYNADIKAAEKTCRMAEKSGVTAVPVRADLADHREVQNMVDEAINLLGHIDILVNNAGIWERNPIDEMSLDRLLKTINTNLLGCFYTTMHTVPRMVKQGSGCIINISSTAGQRGEAFYSPYAASKGALIALTKSLASELVGKNIRVNCVAPGWVETDMTTPILNSDEADFVYDQIPMRRVADPDEIAGPVLFLASEQAGFITGEILNVNGGAVLCG